MSADHDGFKPVGTDWVVNVPPPITHRIHISEGYVICLTGRPPNRFHRFMMRLVFGWRITLEDAE